MNDIESRLRKCFGAVFRRLRNDEIPSATMENVAEWDSAATVMLVAVVEEEFGVQIELDQLESLLSFRSALEYLVKLQESAEETDSERVDVQGSAQRDGLETAQHPKMTFER